MKKISRLSDAGPLVFMLALLRWTSIGVFLAIFLLLALDCVLRYMGRSSVPGSHEMVGILIVYVYVLGLADVYNKKEDVSLQFLSNILPESLKKMHCVFVSFIIMITMIVLSYYSVMVMIRGMSSYTSYLRYPVAIYYIPLAVAGVIVAVTVGLDAIKTYAEHPVARQKTSVNHESKGEGV